MSLTDEFGSSQSDDKSTSEQKAGTEKPCFALYTDGQSYTPARAIDFVRQDGIRSFAYYSYLMGADYDPTASTITLTFTTKTIVLSGSNLKALYEAFMLHLVREIRETNPRYAATQNTDLPLVTGIAVGD